MISILPDGNFIIKNKKGKYKLSSNNNNFITEKYNIASNGFTSIVAAENTTSTQQTQLEEQSLNLKFAYNMDQYVRTTDNVSFANLTVTENTFLYGDLTVIPQSINKYQTTIVNIGDTLIELASNNISDNIDIGFYGKYISNSTTKYAGLFRDAQSSGIFKLFKDITVAPNAHIDVINSSKQGDLMLNTLFTNSIKPADFYYDLNIGAKNGDINNINGGNIILTPGNAFNTGINGNIILSNLPTASSTETLLSITSDGKIKKTNLLYTNIPILNNNLLSVNYTEAKVKSVNGQTGDINISLSGGGSGITSLNGLTGDITDIPTLSANNTFTGSNTFSNTLTLSGTNSDTTIATGQKLIVLDTITDNIQRINITPDNLATLSGTQTISGIKTFTNGIKNIVDFCKNNLYMLDGFVTYKQVGGYNYLYWGGVIIQPSNGSTRVDISCPTSGTITYYNNTTTASTITCTSDGIPFYIGGFVFLYYVIDPTNLSASYSQSNFRIMSTGTYLQRDLITNGTIDPNTWIPIAIQNRQNILVFKPMNLNLALGDTKYDNGDGDLIVGKKTFTGATRTLANQSPGYNAQRAITGGGIVTLTSDGYLKWDSDLLVMNSDNSFFANGHIRITCPVSGTITYYKNDNTTTTVMCTSNGIPIITSTWSAIYYKITNGMSSATVYSNFVLVDYLNTTFIVDDNWILLANTNRDNATAVVHWIATGTNLPANSTYNSRSINVDLDTVQTITANKNFNNTIGMNNNNIIEFGFGVSGKQTHAGKIGYKTFSGTSLDIIGAGTSGTNRSIYMYDNATISNNLTVNNNTTTNSLNVNNYTTLTQLTVNTTATIIGDLNAANFNHQQMVQDVQSNSGIAQNISGGNGLYKCVIVVYGSNSSFVHLVEQYIIKLDNNDFRTNYSQRKTIVGDGTVYLTDGSPFGQPSNMQLWLYNGSNAFARLHISFEYLHYSTG